MQLDQRTTVTAVLAGVTFQPETVTFKAPLRDWDGVSINIRRVSPGSSETKLSDAYAGNTRAPVSARRTVTSVASATVVPRLTSSTSITLPLPLLARLAVTSTGAEGMSFNL